MSAAPPDTPAGQTSIFEQPEASGEQYAKGDCPSCKGTGSRGFDEDGELKPCLNCNSTGFARIPF